MAEKEGFEPSKRFCRLHDFQSCALDQLGDFSIAVKHLRFIHLYTAVRRYRYYYNRESAKVKPLFCFFSKNEEAGERSLRLRPTPHRISETMLSTA